MSQTNSEIEARLDQLRSVSDQAFAAFEDAMRVDPDSDASSAAHDAYEAARAAYDAYCEETEDERIWAPMRARIDLACVGQPPIVQEAMRSGVSLLRMSLTDKERGQLQRARRKSLLVWDPNYMFRKPDRLICSHAIAFGIAEGGSS